MELAGELLETWKRDLVRAPTFYGMKPGRPVETAELGRPFRDLVIRGKRFDEFLASSEDDPTKFASVESYVFPVQLSDGEDAGAIVIVHNRDENGEPFVKEDGEFALGRYYLPGSKAPREGRALQEQFPGALDVVRLTFVDSGVPTQSWFV
jgi:hypothetical protein